MQTEIKFYSGIHTIGGVCMSITYNNHRLLLELGAAYNPSSDIYDGVVKHRNHNFIADSIRLGSIPKIEGFYPKKYLTDDLELTSYEEEPIKTIAMITHLHLDHMLFMGMAHDDIDIYLCDAANTIEQALQDTNDGCYNTRSVPYLNFEHRKPVQFGDIKITPHSIREKSYKDWSFYVETPDLKLHYTGDLIIHNEDQQRVLTEMNWVKEHGADVLVCDCTSFMDSTMQMIYGETDPEVKGFIELPEGMLDEQTVDANLFNNLKEKKGLCVINLYEREMGEVSKFEEMAKKCNRIFVFEPKTAHIAQSFFHKQVHVYLPDFSEYTQESIEATPWLKNLVENHIVVTKDEITMNPSGYLLQNTYPYITELFSLPGENGSYLHSGGIPIGDFDPAYANLMKILDKTQFEYVSFFCENYFSHAYPSEAKYYVDQIDAPVLVPSHSFNPERLLPKPGRQQLIPVLKETYVFENNQLVVKNK